jgi:hypothetical protein
MRYWFLLLVAHVALLVLASTDFTALSGMSDGQFHWQYFRYARQTGWGKAYEFPYSLPVVLTYLTAYATGLAAYLIAWQRGSRIISAAGAVLCTLGFVSFLYELTHWLSDHYDSWILSTPAPLFLLAVAAAVQQWRGKTAA